MACAGSTWDCNSGLPSIRNARAWVVYRDFEIWGSRGHYSPVILPAAFGQGLAATLVLGVTCNKRPCAYANFRDHVQVLQNGLLRYILHTCTPIMGWGGVGMFTFLEHAHMFLHSCLMLRSRWGWGWGGVGMFLFFEHAHMFLHSCLMLRNRWGWGWGGVGMFMFLEHAHVFLHSCLISTCTRVLVQRNMLDAMHLVQIKMPASFLSNMLDATAVMGWGGVGWCSRSVDLATWLMLRQLWQLILWQWFVHKFGSSL